MTDEEIRRLAKEAGFWGVDGWWDDAIPRFRKMMELAKNEEAPPGGEAGAELDKD